MPIRDALSRLKGKLKKGLNIGSKDASPASSSANLTSIASNAPSISTAAPAAKQDTPRATEAPENSTISPDSSPKVHDYPSNSGAALSGTQPHVRSHDEAHPSPHTSDVPKGSQLEPANLLSPEGSPSPGVDKDNQPSDESEPALDKPPTKSGFVWTGAKLLLQVVGASYDVFPPLKSAISGLNECINIYERANKGRKDYDKTSKDIDRLLQELHAYVKDQEAMEMTASVKQVISELNLEVDNLRMKMEGPLVEQWLQAVDASGEISQCHVRIQRLLERLTLNATVNIIKLLKKQDERIDKQALERSIERMSPTLSSKYNSAESDDIRRRGCTPGTRQPQIRSLLTWARSPQAGRIYWMNGMAGTGKTTIAYSFCTELDTSLRPCEISTVEDTAMHTGTCMLGASFFCSRDIPECRQVKNIIPTIAYQLARYSIPFRYALYSILGTEPDIFRLALKIQYAKLIVEPLTMVQGSLPADFIVVIDALDECENANSLGEILDLLLSTPITLPIRFLVSSRPEPEITRRMEGRVNEISNTRLVLHNIDVDLVRSDIEVFMRRELKDIPLTDSQWSGLLKRCGTLFIYASTTCRFIREEHASKALDEAVKAIIGPDSAHMERGDDPTIDELYTTILKAALGEKSKMRPEKRKRIRDILETVLCAGEPLKLATLAGLLGRDSAEQVEALLQPLRSVLNVTTDTGVVTTLHASFPDFMFSDARSGDFHCQRANRDLAMAKACLATIDAIQPKFNICGLSSSYPADNQVQNLDRKIKEAITPGLAYACRYWSTHLYLGNYVDELVETVRRFFTDKLLLWMEIMNLTKCMRLGPSIIQHAERWCSQNAIAEDINKLVHDSQQFVSVYASNPVCQSTPHIYLSMLPFWPESRPVSTTYLPRAVGIVEPKGTAIIRRQTALLATWKISSGPVSSISLSADGTRMVVASDDAIDILDTSTGEGVIHVQEPQTSRVRAVAVSADATRVAFGSPSGAYILDLNTRQITQLQPDEISGVLCVAFSPDESHVAIGSESGRAYVCSTREANQTGHTLEGHTGRVRSVTFSPDGRQVASASDDHTIRVWDTKSGQMAGDPLQGHNSSVFSVSFSPNGQLLASCSADGTIRIWDVKTGQTILGPLQGHSSWVRSVTFSPDGTFIASGSEDNTIRVYDATTGQTILGPLQAHTDYVLSVIVTPDSTRLFSCSDDGTIRLWNVQDRHVPDTQHPTVPRVFRCVRYSPDGSRVVSGSYDGAVCVWDVQTGDIVLGPLQGHSDVVWGVDYSPDGAYIASASSDSTLRMWSAQDGKDIHGPIQGHTQGVRCVRFSADSSLLVSGSRDKTVRIWDVKTGQQLNQPLQGHSDSVYSVAFSPNRSHVVSGSSYRTIRVWDIQTGQTVIDPLQGHENWVRSVEFSSDGSRILSGSDDKSIRIWDAVSGQSLLFFGHNHGRIYSVGFSPDGGLVVSGSHDGTVCVWDAQNGQLMLTLDGHTDWVASVQMSPDGSHVVSCSEDGTIRLWDVSSCQGHVRDDHVKGTNEGERNDYGQVEAASKPWMLRRDGWVVDRQAQLLVWVPSDLQPYILLPPNHCIIPKSREFKVEFGRVNMGDQWTRCYQA